MKKDRRIEARRDRETYSSDWTGWNADPIGVYPEGPEDRDEGESLVVMLLAAVVVGISIGVLIVYWLR